jgi:hypothetical protein
MATTVKLSAAQDELIAAKTDVVKPHQLVYWTYEGWTPGKTLVGLYLGPLAPGNSAGLIAGNRTLRWFHLDGNLVQQLKPVPLGAPLEIHCLKVMVKEALVFRVRWRPPKKARR